MPAATTSAAWRRPSPIWRLIPERLGLKSPAVLIFGEVAGLPAHGVIEDILSMEEVKYA